MTQTFFGSHVILYSLLPHIVLVLSRLRISMVGPTQQAMVFSVGWHVILMQDGLEHTQAP